MKNKNTILIVDDDQAHRTMLRTLIAGWDYTIDEADDGSTAIEKVRDQVYDLVLMDIRMIKVSGLEALSEIKALNPAIPVIIMTAYSSVDTAVRNSWSTSRKRLAASTGSSSGTSGMSSSRSRWTNKP